MVHLVFDGAMSHIRKPASRIVIGEGLLQKHDIMAVRAILAQHVIDRLTGQPVLDEIERIIACMREDRDELGRRRKYFVARQADSGLVLGCMSYSDADRKIAEHCGIAVEESVELHNVFVSRCVQGMGVGRELFRTVCMAAQEEGKKWLLVVSGPRYSQSWGFYDAVCDTCAGYILNAYGDGVHAKTWSKSLAEPI
jgi:predicted N-acetyltransferase YhbS